MVKGKLVCWPARRWRFGCVRVPTPEATKGTYRTLQAAEVPGLGEYDAAGACASDWASDSADRHQSIALAGRQILLTLKSNVSLAGIVADLLISGAQRAALDDLNSPLRPPLCCQY